MTEIKIMASSKFIQQYKTKTLSEIALVLSKKPELDKEFILNQINGIQKAKNKLPEFYDTADIVYPSKLSMEQCSSEKTAIYKSEIIKGKSLIDLTGGFGVDSFYFSKKIAQLTYVEQNESLFLIAKNNFKRLKAGNINLVNSFAEKYIKTIKHKVDIVYIDPSRRNENKRVYQLNECTPNIIELTSKIFKIANKILIKTAPLLDIKQTLKDLKYVTKVWVVALNNDCKEVLYLLENGKDVEPEICTINLTKFNQEFHFNYLQESIANVEYSTPKNYLYEPNAAILKAGAFKSICQEFNLKKIANNTHLYTSEKLVKNFCGRSFEITTVANYNAKEFKKLGLQKANVNCRNFKDSVEQVKKKLTLKDGGENYLFATTNLNNKTILLICIKT